MDKNVKIAKQLVRIAKMLVSNAGDDIESMSVNEALNLAKNKNTSPEILEKLAEDEDKNVRKAVAKNPKTPVDILKKLVEDKKWEVRYEVAENPNTPVEALRKLADDKDWIVGSAAERALRKRGQ